METEKSPNPTPDLHEHADEEPWLISYADMMTLLFAFFVLMYTFASAKNQGAEELVRVRKKVAEHFGGPVEEPLKAVEQKIQSTLKASPLAQRISTRISPEGLTITLSSSALFASGSARLQPRTEKWVQQMIRTIGSAGRNFNIIVEGHTDDVPISTRQFPSNWELSAGRASSVVRMFEEHGFNAAHMRAVGYGASQPAKPNRTPEGVPIPSHQAENRRVVIKITGDLDQPHPSKH